MQPVEPVSYTHLDVYKRQAQAGPTATSTGRSSGSSRNSEGTSRSTRTPTTPEKSSKPVSYTHLDGYKRQPDDLRPGMRAELAETARTVIEVEPDGSPRATIAARVVALSLIHI